VGHAQQPLAQGDHFPRRPDRRHHRRAVVAYWPLILAFIEQEAIRAERAKMVAPLQVRRFRDTPICRTFRDASLHGPEPGTGFPAHLRREFELELWLKRNDRFYRFATYPICMWSGNLGPKLRQGDRQSPEGFYTVDATALNPASKYHRSFNLGFPNAFDSAHGRTGSLLMVHGHFLSIGCYAMTDPVIDEIWNLVTAALKSGQKRFQAQVFPFRMTDANMARHEQAGETPFWRQLKEGHDLFERDHAPPEVSVCQGRYVFRSAGGSKDGDRSKAAARPHPRAADTRERSHQPRAKSTRCLVEC
jgi:murein L,D-transpeptidase YafK